MKKLVILSFILALSVCTPAFSVDSEVIEDYMDIISNDCLLGDYADAVKYLDRIIQMAPQDAEFPKLKRLLYQLGTTDQRSFMDGYNKDIDKALTYKRLGDRINMGNTLVEATKSGNFWVFGYLGDYYRENKNYKPAIEAYFQAYQMQPSYTQALLAIAICYLESGEYESVHEPIKRFLYQNQQCDLAYAIRAKAYMNSNQLNDAETEIVTAIALNDDIEYQLIHGIILYKKANYTRAINVLSKVAEEVQTAEVFKYLGLSYLGRKEYSNAMLNLDKAILLSDDDIELNQKYNETRELIKNINEEKLQNEEREEVKQIYEDIQEKRKRHEKKKKQTINYFPYG